MTVTTPTGSELLDLFADVSRRVEVKDGPAYGAARHTQPMWRTLASATVPMHVRDGIALSGLAAGILTGGTAAGDEGWAGELVAARGWVRMLDSGRLADDGVRHRVWPREPDEPWPLLLLTEMLSAFTKPQAHELGALAGYADPHDDPHAELVRLARGMSDVPAVVAVERPPVPELTDRPLENARRLFGLTVGQLADLFGVTERQMHRYLRDGLPANRRALADALTAVGLTVIGGLGADGARRWLFSGEPTGAQLARRGDIAELAARAEGLRDSPVT